LLEVTPSLTEFDAGTYQVESKIFLDDGTLIDAKTTSFVVDKKYQNTTDATPVQQETQPPQTVSSQPTEKTTATQTQQGNGSMNFSWIPVCIIAGVLIIGIVSILWTTKLPAGRKK
jgi:cobalamin biosynthesis Mg chelatase CobN